MIALHNPNANTQVVADALFFRLGGPHTKATIIRSSYLRMLVNILRVLVSKSFHINIDHKSLVPIVSLKRLDELPLRV